MEKEERGARDVSLSFCPNANIQQAKEFVRLTAPASISPQTQWGFGREAMHDS